MTAGPEHPADEVPLPPDADGRLFEVRAQVTENAAMTGVWAAGKTAVTKYGEWIGLFSRGSVPVTLTVRTGDGPPVTLRRWPPPPETANAPASRTA
jgi:hypothetical protein